MSRPTERRSRMVGTPKEDGIIIAVCLFVIVALLAVGGMQ